MRLAIVGFATYDLFCAHACGGFGEVYRVSYASLPSRTAAVKILREDLVGGQIERFEREAKRVAQLPSPTLIVRVPKYSVLACLPCDDVDYPPEGNSWQRYHFGRAVSLPRVVSYVCQLASSLQYVHSFGVVHCDVKPENM